MTDIQNRVLLQSNKQETYRKLKLKVICVRIFVKIFRVCILRNRFNLEQRNYSTLDGAFKEKKKREKIGQTCRINSEFRNYFSSDSFETANDSNFV